MSEQNIIKAIEIEIAGVTVKVTPEEAHKLHAALGELLNIPTEKIVEKEVVKDRLVPYPYVPYVNPQPYWYTNGIRWTTVNGTTTVPLKDITVTYNTTSNIAKVVI